MPRRSSKKRPADINELARAIVDDATTGEVSEEKPSPATPKKNPAAVELGRLGGKKGGLIRAARLTAEERRAIARKGAEARWHGVENDR